MSIAYLYKGYWYKYGEGGGQWLLADVYDAYSSNATLGPYAVPFAPQQIFDVVLTVHSVSGTSPTLTVNLVYYDMYAYQSGYQTSSSTTIFSNLSSAGVYTYSATNTPYTVIQFSLALGGTSSSFTISLSVYIR
jgi:hypothetical protein